MGLSKIKRQEAQVARARREADKNTISTARDFGLQDEGSLVILYPESEEAEAWAEEHLPDDATMWSSGYAIERRYLDAILAGIEEAGLTVGKS
jgi:hypothetical protein